MRAVFRALVRDGELPFLDSELVTQATTPLTSPYSSQ